MMSAARGLMASRKFLFAPERHGSASSQLLKLYASLHSRHHLLDRVLSSRLNDFHQSHALRHNSSSSSSHSHLQYQKDAQSHPSDFIIRSPYPDIPIPEDVSLPHLIMDRLPKYGNKTAIVDGVTGQEMTYSEVHTSVAKVTSALVKLGLRKGDVITIFSTNCPQFVIATLAIVATGAIISAVNPTYTLGELKNSLSHVNSRFLITIPDLLPVAREAVKECPSVQEIIVFGEAEHCRPFSSLLAGDTSQFPENVDFRPREDVLALLFSSGTTGLPKAVMLSHYSVVANVLQNREDEVLGYEAGIDTLFALPPFYHIYGLTMIMFAGLFCGARLVTLPNFQPVGFLEAIQNYKPTFLHLVPPLLLFLAKHQMVLNYDLSSMQKFFVGAAPSPVNTIYEFLNRMKRNVTFQQGYGLTEASPLTHCGNPKANKYHTVGPAINNTEFKVVDLETREPLGPGKSGEVCIRGPQLMIGYYENKQATEETLVDGWLQTGDVGHYDDDGHVIIDDRIKELIKVKGLQVAPAELEAVLVSHPSVQDAAVVGLKDEKLGEAPKAFVVLKPQEKTSAEELKKYVDERVAPFKRLSGGIEFRAEIPKSASGKILRRILKAEVNQK